LTLGRTAIAGKNLYTNEAIAALPIKPEFSSSIDLDYLITYFSFFDWAGFAASDEKLLGKTLNKKKLAEVPILFPPLSVQRAIVARLEKELGEADKLAAKFKRIAQLADDEFKAELDETFKTIEGEKVRLGDVFEFIDYRGKTPLKTESGVPLITAKNIRQGYLDYHESFYISEKEYATRQTRGIARKGDILFTTEAPLGFVALADKEEFSTGQRVITFQWKGNGERACNKYYLYCLLSDWFQSALWKQATGATAKGIKASRLTNLHVLCVPVSDQEKIVAKLDAAKERCEKLKAVALRGLAAAENLRKAILAEAFEQ
jgi:type I restriction enzyme S subunit